MTEMKPKDQINEYGEYRSKEKEFKQELDRMFGDFRPNVSLGVYSGDRPDSDPLKGKGFGQVSFTYRNELPDEDWKEALKWVKDKGFEVIQNTNYYDEEPGERSWYPVIKFEFDVANFPTDVDSNTMNEWIKRQWQRRAGIIK